MKFNIENRRINVVDGENFLRTISENKDYIAEFTFDDEWNNVTKTARFTHKGTYTDVLLEDDKCNIPVETWKAGIVVVGVYSSDMTTTGCAIYVDASIKSVTGVEAEPTTDIYEQLLARLDGISEKYVLTPKTFGAVGDGVKDDIKAMQDAFNALESTQNNILDLQGSVYLISEPINVGKIYNKLIKNGTIKASDDFIGESIFICPGDFSTETNPGSGYRVINDITLEKLILDCNNKTSALKLVGFLKFKVLNVTFWNYTEFGIYTTRLDAHELVVDNCFLFTKSKTATAIKLSNHDNIFSNIVIEGGLYGIYINQGVHMNMFNGIHIYGVTPTPDYSIGVYLDLGAGHNIFNDIYFDGCGVYTKTYYGVYFDNCIFLAQAKNFIIVDAIASNKIDNFQFSNCYIYELSAPASQLPIVTLIGGVGYNIKKTNKLEFAITSPGATLIDNRNLLALTEKNSNFNFFNISDSAEKFEFNNSGKRFLPNPMTSYATRVINSVCYVDSFNSSGYHWYGFEVFLDKNTDYIIQDLLIGSAGAIQVVGVDALDAVIDTVVLASGSVAIEWLKFNTGDNNHIFVINYEKSMAPCIKKYF